MQHTTNYNLNQWEADDRVTREDFNADNAAIDAALKSVSDASPEIVFGTYTGNTGSATPHTISIGRKPKAVWVQHTEWSASDATYRFTGFAAQGLPISFSTGKALELTDDGFTVANIAIGGGSYLYPNLTDKLYIYVALC